MISIRIKSYIHLVTIIFLISSCGGGGGGGSDPTPAPYPSPQISFSASSDSSQINEDITLTWSSTNASSCSASGDWEGSRTGISGSETIKSKEERELIHLLAIMLLVRWRNK